PPGQFLQDPQLPEDGIAVREERFPDMLSGEALLLQHEDLVALPCQERRSRGSRRPPTDDHDVPPTGHQATVLAASTKALAVRSPRSRCQTWARSPSTSSTALRISDRTQGSSSSYTSPWSNFSSSSRYRASRRNAVN